MTRDELIAAIADDLQNEWKHLQYYMHHRTVFRGVHMLTLKPIFEEEMRTEVEHVAAFSDLLVHLGTTAALRNDGPAVPQYTAPREILQHAQQMETEVSENYVQRIRQAEELGGAEGKLVQLFYEKQLEESYTDAKKFARLLEGFTA